jgi:putative heme transporter
MSESAFLKRRWKLLLNIVTIVALVVLAYAVRHQLVATISNFKKVNLWALLLIIPIELWNYDAQARLYQRLFAIAGDKLKYSFWFGVSLEMNFINSVFPSGGVSGISYLGMRLRRNDIRAGRAALVQLMKLVLIFFSFEALLLIGLLFLAAGGRVSNFTVLIAGSLTTLLVVCTLAAAYIVGDRERINAFFTFMTRLANRLIAVVRPGHPEAIDIERVRSLFDELHENYVLFQKRLTELKAPFIDAFFANLSEVLAVYVVYIAFGHWVNLGAVILAYAVANFAGLVSVLPGGVGTYEALMTAVLVAGGIPAALSIPVVVMYRVVNTIIQVPAGYYFYHRTLHSDGQPEAQAV